MDELPVLLERLASSLKGKTTISTRQRGVSVMLSSGKEALIRLEILDETCARLSTLAVSQSEIKSRDPAAHAALLWRRNSEQAFVELHLDPSEKIFVRVEVPLRAPAAWASAAESLLKEQANIRRILTGRNEA